jgi:hypothetical protein
MSVLLPAMPPQIRRFAPLIGPRLSDAVHRTSRANHSQLGFDVDVK